MAGDIWNDTEPDWTSDEARRFLDLLSRAFPTWGALVTVAGELDVVPANPDPSESLRDTWSVVLVEAARDGLMLDLAAVVLQSADRHWASMLRRLLSASGNPGAAAVAERRRQERYGIPASAEDQQHDVVDLEALDPNLPPFTSLHETAAALVRGTRRVAVIDVEGALVGTGCLVAADLLLTAHHVIEDHHDKDLVAVFDYGPDVLGAGRQERRVDVREIVIFSKAAQSERDRVPAAWEGIGPETLDFALLRLADDVACQLLPQDTEPRGRYRLFEQRYELSTGLSLTAINHALGQPAKDSPLSGSFELNRLETRFRYRAQTLEGSSGGPIIDRRGRLVAMHTGAVTAGDGAFRGQAVPAWMIARHVRSHAPALMDVLEADLPAVAAPPPARDVPRLLASLEIDGQPFVDRQDLRHLLEQTWDDDTSRRLVVEGTAGAGVSTSYSLMAHVAAALDSMSAIKIDLRRLRAEDDDERMTLVMEDIVGRLARSSLGDKVPDPGWIDSQLQQHARSVAKFRNYCSRQLHDSDRRWWIFFDSIDTASELTGLEELVEVLRDLSTDRQINLGLALAGRAVGELPPSLSAGALTDVASGLERHHCESWIRARASADGRDVDTALLATRLDQLFAGGRPQPTVVQLSLPEILDATTSVPAGGGE